MAAGDQEMLPVLPREEEEKKKAKNVATQIRFIHRQHNSREHRTQTRSPLREIISGSLRPADAGKLKIF
jgi:hypothetical protein